jgi:hypothetical protein
MMDNVLYYYKRGAIIIPYNTQAIILAWHREDNAFIYHFPHAFTTGKYVDHYHLLLNK